MRSDSECLSVSLAHCYEQVFCGTGLSPSLMIISHLKSRYLLLTLLWSRANQVLILFIPRRVNAST